jgi:hypothetical protein
MNHRIRLVTPLGATSTIAGGGASPSFADGVGTAARFNKPFGIAEFADRSIAVTDAVNHRIRIISPSRVVSTLAGSGVASSVNGVGLAASFNVPIGIALYSNGDLAVSEHTGHRIRVVTPLGVTTTLAGQRLLLGILMV